MKSRKMVKNSMNCSEQRNEEKNCSEQRNGEGQKLYGFPNKYRYSFGDSIILLLDA